MKKSKNPKIIVFLGRSGSGKGTQAKLLIKKFGLNYVGSGDLLRARARKGDFTGRKLNNILKFGGFAPSALISRLWFDKWEKLKDSSDFQGFILDGSPRRMLEKYFIDEALGWYEWDKIAKVVLIDISRKEAFDRLAKRRICIKCGQLIPYVGEFKKIKECHKCGGKLKARSDDTPAGIKSRLDLFDREVKPVLRVYKKEKKLITINGEQSIENVFKEILANI